MVKVVHDKPVCIGCSACVSVADKFWEMKGAKSHLKGSKLVGQKEVLDLGAKANQKDVELNKDAAEVCPVNCISVEK